MEKGLLERFLAAGLSLDNMAARTGKSASTVSYWLRKHGLKPLGADKHTSRGGLTKHGLEDLIAEGLTIESIAHRVERSDATVRYWLKRYGLSTQPAALRAEAREARRVGLKRIDRECSKHGLVPHVLEPDRVRCVKCRAEAVARRRRKVKRILVAEAGGQCAICGYDRSPVALEFHHLDPATKSFNLSIRGITRSIDKLRAEARKCVLLCAICHAEVEAGIAKLPLELEVPTGTRS
ncbi:MAG: hypothetical protein AABM29_02490 [Actinomycetota bacterium]